MKLSARIKALPPTIWWLALLMLAALAVRLVHWHVYPMESRDGIYYVQFLQHWFEAGNDGLPAFGRMPPPLFCYLGRALMYCHVSAATALLSINMLCGVLTVVPAYLIGRTIYDDGRAGLWFAGFAAVMPPLVAFSCTRIRECLYLFCVFWFVWAWIMTVKHRRERVCALLCGAISVIAMHCRYEAAELFLFALGSLPIAGLFPNWRWRRCGVIALCVLFGAVVTVSVMRLLPGMPDIFQIFYSQLRVRCPSVF